MRGGFKPPTAACPVAELVRETRLEATHELADRFGVTRSSVAAAWYDLSRPAVEIARIAAFLRIAVSPDACAAVAEAVSFASMKRNARALVPHNEDVFVGGAETFINKGVNGRWRSVLDGDDLTAYEAAARRTLSDDCRAWLEGGPPPSA